VPFGHIQRSQTARVGHQVLHLSCAPHCVQPRLAVDAAARSQAPQRVVQTVAVEDGDKRQRLAVGLRLSKMAQQLGPAISARLVGADFVEGGVGHFCLL
jgi:hypothetical protein